MNYYVFIKTDEITMLKKLLEKFGKIENTLNWLFKEGEHQVKAIAEHFKNFKEVTEKSFSGT